VLGFPGTQQLMPAVVRGDLDGIVTSQETALAFGDLVPLLRLAPTARRGVRSPGPEVPDLFGSGGIVGTRPELMMDAKSAATDGAALEALLRVGRLVAAPANLPGPLTACLRDAVTRSLSDGQLRARAERVGRSLDPATAKEVAGYIRDASEALPRFGDLLRAAIARASG
jgi:hypothetical protein